MAASSIAIATTTHTSTAAPTLPIKRATPHKRSTPRKSSNISFIVLSSSSPPAFASPPRQGSRNGKANDSPRSFGSNVTPGLATQFSTAARLLHEWSQEHRDEDHAEQQHGDSPMSRADPKPTFISPFFHLATESHGSTIPRKVPSAVLNSAGHQDPNERPSKRRDEINPKRTPARPDHTTSQTQLHGLKIRKPMKDVPSTHNVLKAAPSLPEDFRTPDDTFEAAEVGLQRAIPRRRAWTPPQVIPGETEEPLQTPGSLAAPSSVIHENDETFKTNVSKFQCTNTMPTRRDITAPAPCEEAASRKRRIELVDVDVSLQAVMAPGPQKPARRRPATITEKAMDTYDNARAAAQIFDDGVNPTIDLSAVAQVMSARATAPNRASRRKGQRPSAQQMVHPPEQAMVVLGAQTFTFCTSSQLAQDEQFAQGNQNSTDVAVRHNTIVEAPCSYRSVELLAPQTKVLGQQTRSLWTAAARDAGGEVCVIDPVIGSPKAAQAVIEIQDSEVEDVDLSLDADEGITAPDSFGLQHLDNMHKGTVIECAAPPSNDQGASHDKVLAPLQVLPRSIAEAALAKRHVKPPEAETEELPDLHNRRGRRSAQELQQICGDHAASMPDFEHYSAKQLECAVAGYGFKPIKSRTTMVALLRRCWDSQQRLVQQSRSKSTRSTRKISADEKTPARRKRASKKGDAPKDEDASDVAESAKTPRAKPSRKSRIKSTADAETPTTPKPRGRPRKKKAEATVDVEPATAIVQTEASRVDCIETPENNTNSVPAILVTGNDDAAEPRVGLQDLDTDLIFEKIFQVIVKTPAVEGDPSPSWREKMLMYDPIIIEDLTAWLNTTGLGRVGVDEEVPASMVRAWCESQSLCCLWKTNVHGLERVRS